MSAPSFQWPLVSRYAFLVALAQLIPVPILDVMVENWIRRRLTHIQLAAWGIELPGKDVRMLGDSSAGGCLGLVWSVIVWPIKKLLRTVLFVLQLNAMVNVFSDVVHRALLVHEALEHGLIPGDAVQVRAAMNRALKDIDTRVVERGLASVFKQSRVGLLKLFLGERGRIREEVRAERGDVEVSDVDRAPLHDKAEAMTQALAAAAEVPGVQAELLRRFRKEAEAL